jgi:NADH-quinone oxidoreductase subunit D
MGESEVLLEVQKSPLDSQMTLNMGPQHPSTHGVLRIVLTLDGERVMDAKPDIGYLHTGMEKLAEYKKYQHVITITDRTDYLNAMGNNLGYVLAVEKLLGIEIPPRAQVIRVMMTELQRIASHLVWIGTHGLDLGAMSLYFYAFAEREKILQMFEAASGGRLTPSYFRIGGVMADLPNGLTARVLEFCRELPQSLREFDRLLTGNPIFRMRTEGVGRISADEAIRWGVTGPSLRACGVPYDLRRVHPYTGYDAYDFEVVTRTAGDVYARYLVRVQEMHESLKLVRQAVGKLAPGPIKSDDPRVSLPSREEMLTQMDALIYHFLLTAEGLKVPPGEVYFAVESPRGELGYYVISNGGPKPYRVHIRAPSFAATQALPVMMRGQLIADVVAVIASTDIVLGEIDR